MTPEEWKQFGEVLITWGFGFIVFGAITMLIGFVILVCLDVKTVKKIAKIINN
jgi:uncharacterized membrane protein